MDSQTTTISEPVSKVESFKKILRKYWKFIGIVLPLLLLIIFLSVITKSTVKTSAEKVSVANPNQSFEINKDFSFPLKDNNNVDISKINYTVENAQLLDEIIIKGQKALAVEGKTFLIINLKLTNDFNQPIQINTRDYIRLVIDGKEKDLLAPDIHNDPVEVQPISSKFTRVGFPINENYKKLELKVGEISKDKKNIELKF